MDQERCKATITIGDKTITFEGPPEFVESQVAKHTGPETKGADQAHSLRLPTQANVASGLTERDLVASKQPRGHHEIAAVLAFALTNAGVEEFTEEDIRKAYIRAGVRPPKAVGQALRDAKNNFEYIEAGTKRGTYRLSSHGDSVVRFDLPRGGSNG